MTLACHLDKLEMVHFLDLMGADINKGTGIGKNTPLMSATMKWNVRIVEYLTERGADPSIQDKYGFTAKRKAEIKNLKTIHSMLSLYENEYTTKSKKA